MDLGLRHKKNPNPRETANPISAATFTYALPTFIQGYKKKSLEVTDLYETFSAHKSSKLGDEIEAEWRKEEEDAKRTKRQPSLRKILIKMFALDVVLGGFFLTLNEIVFRIAQPLFLGQLIVYYLPNQTTVSDLEVYLYAGGIVLTSLFNVFIVHPTMMGFFHVGMKMRVGCCSLIYRKSLRLSKTAFGQTTAGQIVNLLSNDVNRFDLSMSFVHYLWLVPLQTLIITYFMYKEVGVSAITGVVFLLLFIPIQFLLANKAAVYRLTTALRTDERVRLMNEIISGIQVIKMYTWEKPFEKVLAFTRRFEIKAITSTSYIKGISLSFIMFTTRVSLFLTVLTYLLQDYEINAKQVFVLTAFYNVLRTSMTVGFPQAIIQITEVNVSIKRLTTFMLYEETTCQIKEPEEQDQKSPIQETPIINNNDVNEDDAITIKDGTAKWTETVIDNTFSNVNIKIKRGGLVAVIGPVGSGKTSLLHAILKELPLAGGSINIDGKISYASQEPWLFTGSVQQNILFGQSLDKLRYRSVVRKCALQRDFELFPYGDKTVVGERGVSLSGGQRARINLARAVYKQADIYLLDDPLSAVDTHVGTQLFDECIQGYLREKTVILITHQLQYLKDVDHIVILDDGVVKAQGSFDELQRSGLDFAKLLNSGAEENNGEKVEKRPVLQTQTSRISTISEEVIFEDPKGVEEEIGKGSISSHVYKAYLTAGANGCVTILVLSLFILAQLACSGGDYFITYWMNLEEARGTTELAKNSFQESSNSTTTDFLTTETCIYIYSAITIALISITLIRSFSFFNICMRGSINLHDKMFHSISHATMRFFNTNTSGRILNRFSKDIGAVDELLPLIIMDCLQIGLTLIGIVVVVAVVNPYLMIPTILISLIFYLLRIFYLSTSRSIKRLEGVTRSPVFAHLNATLQGLTTIRAFGAERILEREFDLHQDLHSSAWYSFLSTSRAFGFWLDLFCVLYIGLVTLSSLIMGKDEYGGNVGLAITQALGLTGMFQWGMRQSAELENQMTSVERVLQYSSVEHEADFESSPDKKPPSTWPDRGEIKFVNLYLKYFPDDPPVLKDLNVVIRPLEKVGIVGRTGAGKSSLIAALFRLTDIQGSILLDGVDTQSLGLHDLRSKISIIPQEPVLFSGTMRKNLDPFDEYDDDVLWKALEEVELKEAVSDLVSGLDSKMSEGGSNFSVGQRQLVCLARAIIRNNKVLVLDEATANVDPQTDALIQETIRKKFAFCTVLTIAHRLNTVMDSDKVLVMDAGTMVEFDHPHVLLQNRAVFYGMVEQTGPIMAENLRKIAERSYKQLQVTTYM